MRYCSIPDIGNLRKWFEKNFSYACAYHDSLYSNHKFSRLEADIYLVKYMYKSVMIKTVLSRLTVYYPTILLTFVFVRCFGWVRYKAIAAMIRELKAQNNELIANLESADRGKQYAYYERNMLVVALSKLFPAHIEFHPEGDESWDKEWRNIIMIELPTGQASWHIHDSELNNFVHLKHAKGNSWDGHYNDIKYARLNALEARKEKDNA